MTAQVSEFFVVVPRSTSKGGLSQKTNVRGVVRYRSNRKRFRTIPRPVTAFDTPDVMRNEPCAHPVTIVSSPFTYIHSSA